MYSIFGTEIFVLQQFQVFTDAFDQFNASLLNISMGSLYFDGPFNTATQN